MSIERMERIAKEWEEELKQGGWIKPKYKKNCERDLAKLRAKIVSIKKFYSLAKIEEDKTMEWLNTII